MKVEWIEDAPSPQKPTPLPSVVQVNVPSKQPSWLLIAIVAVCAYLYWTRQQPQPSPQPDDQTIVVDDDTQPQPQPTPVDLKGSTLVFVLENTSPTANQTEVMLSVNTQELRSRGFEGFRRYDEEQAEVQSLVEHAVSKNTPSPFVVLMRDKKCIKLAPFPKSPAELEAFLR